MYTGISWASPKALKNSYKRSVCPGGGMSPPPHHISLFVFLSFLSLTSWHFSSSYHFSYIILTVSISLSTNYLIFPIHIWCASFGVKAWGQCLLALTSFTEVHRVSWRVTFTSDKIDVESWEGWVVPGALVSRGKKDFSEGFEPRDSRKGTARGAEWPHRGCRE